MLVTVCVTLDLLLLVLLVLVLLVLHLLLVLLLLLLLQLQPHLLHLLKEDLVVKTARPLLLLPLLLRPLLLRPLLLLHPPDNVLQRVLRAHARRPRHRCLARAARCVHHRRRKAARSRALEHVRPERGDGVLRVCARAGLLAHGVLERGPSVEERALLCEQRRVHVRLGRLVRRVRPV